LPLPFIRSAEAAVVKTTELKNASDNATTKLFLYRPIKGANSPSVYLDKAADDKQPAHAHVAHFGEGDLLGAVHSL